MTFKDVGFRKEFLKDLISFHYTPLLNILFEHGVGGLFAFSQDTFGYQELEAGYISQCHLCVDIRKHIVSRTQEFKELKPLEFYSQIGAERSR